MTGRLFASRILLYVLTGLCLTALSALSQEVAAPLSVTKEADTLMARLLRNPRDAEVQRKLIDEYVRTSNPELALIEIAYAESFGLTENAGPGLKGRVQANLEEVVPAVNNLEHSYLLHPDDEVLETIAILHYVRGQRVLGKDILRRLRMRFAGLSVDLLNQYEKFYLNNRTVIARAISDALRDLDPASFETFFPSPRVAILSPADNLSTEAKDLSVIVEVRHSRPIKSVMLNGKAVFEREETPVKSVNETVNRSFSQMVQLSEGKNSIPVTVTDIFGIETTQPLTINSTSFGMRTGWQSRLVDSLHSDMSLLRSYVDERELRLEKNSSYRTFIVAGSRGIDSSACTERGLFVYDLLTNPLIGYTTNANAKLLVGDRLNRANISLIGDNWLIQGSTFRSVTTVYLCGDWIIRDNQWLLTDMNGAQVDMKPLLSKLARTASAGVTVLFDGTVDYPASFTADLNRWVQSCSVPVCVCILPNNASWCERVTRNLATPFASMTAGAFFSSWDFEQVASSSAYSPQKKTLFFGQSPGRKVAGAYHQLLVDLDQKLDAVRVTSAVKTRILRFSESWRRYSEVTRFLQNKLTLEDLVARVNDYFDRNPNELRNSQ